MHGSDYNTLKMGVPTEWSPGHVRLISLRKPGLAAYKYLYWYKNYFVKLLMNLVHFTF